MSPQTGTPAATASRTTPSSSESPGLTHSRSASSSNAGVNAPHLASAEGTAAFSAASLGGSSRESATRARPPSRATHFATDKPVSPRPSTSTRLPASAMGCGRVSDANGGSVVVIFSNASVT